MSGKKKNNKNSSSRNDKFVRVKSAKGRRTSSTNWLQRQLNDPYVRQAKQDGYRSRAAYKLIQINDKYGFIKPNSYVVDLGAAPGSWSQVVADIIEKGRGKIIGIDLQEIEPIAGVDFIHGDFLDEGTYIQLKELLKDSFSSDASSDKAVVDVVMSDMAAASCGHAQTDHIRIVNLCEVALEFAIETLKEGGTFLAKSLRGGGEGDLVKRLKSNFKAVKHIKPDSSRADSAEMYVIATGFKG